MCPAHEFVCDSLRIDPLLCQEHQQVIHQVCCLFDNPLVGSPSGSVLCCEGEFSRLFESFAGSKIGIGNESCGVGLRGIGICPVRDRLHKAVEYGTQCV